MSFSSQGSTCLRAYALTHMYIHAEFRNPLWAPDVRVWGCHLEARECLNNDSPFWVSHAGCQSWHICHLIPAAALLVGNAQFTVAEEETEIADSCKTDTASPSSLKFNSWCMGWHPMNVCWMTTLLESQPPTQGFHDSEGLVGACTQHFCFSKGLAQFFKAITMPKHQVLVIFGDWHRQRWREPWYLLEENLMERQFSLSFDMLLFLKFKIIIYMLSTLKNFYIFFQL